MIDKQTSLSELATIVSETLENAGITATLSGGAAVSIYSDNKYESVDLNFVTTALVAELKTALEPIGFVRTGRPASLYLNTRTPTGTLSSHQPH
jgi:hypothetical protein